MPVLVRFVNFRAGKRITSVSGREINYSHFNLVAGSGFEMRAILFGQVKKLFRNPERTSGTF